MTLKDKVLHRIDHQVQQHRHEKIQRPIGNELFEQGLGVWSDLFIHINRNVLGRAYHILDSPFHNSLGALGEHMIQQYDFKR
jgi:hypothetical protein